jgi:hypothetical protein
MVRVLQWLVFMGVSYVVFRIASCTLAGVIVYCKGGTDSIIVTIYAALD